MVALEYINGRLLCGKEKGALCRWKWAGCALLLVWLLAGCGSKSSGQAGGDAPVLVEDSIDNRVGMNDTLGLSLHPERPVCSTHEKQLMFVLSNHGDTSVSFGGYYSYTYEDAEGRWRAVPMDNFVVFQEELILFQGDTYYYFADLFKRTPGRYRFFLPVRKSDREYTLMTEFQLKDTTKETVACEADR